VCDAQPCERFRRVRHLPRRAVRSVPDRHRQMRGDQIHRGRGQGVGLGRVSGRRRRRRGPDRQVRLNAGEVRDAHRHSLQATPDVGDDVRGHGRLGTGDPQDTRAVGTHDLVHFAPPSPAESDTDRLTQLECGPPGQCASCSSLLAICTRPSRLRCSTCWTSAPCAAAPRLSHEVVGVEPLRLPQRHQVLETEHRRMPVALPVGTPDGVAPYEPSCMYIWARTSSSARGRTSRPNGRRSRTWRPGTTGVPHTRTVMPRWATARASDCHSSKQFLDPRRPRRAARPPHPPRALRDLQDRAQHPPHQR